MGIDCAIAAPRGAAHTINYSNEDPVERVLAITAGKGANLILDQFVGPKFGRTFEMVATLGTVLVYNFTGGMPAHDVMQGMGAHIAKSAALRVFSMHCFDDDPGVNVSMTPTPTGRRAGRYR